MQAVRALYATDAKVAADQAFGVAAEGARITSHAAFTGHAGFIFAIASDAREQLLEPHFEGARAKLRVFGHGAVAERHVRSTRRSSAARARVSASSASSSRRFKRCSKTGSLMGAC